MAGVYMEAAAVAELFEGMELRSQGIKFPIPAQGGAHCSLDISNLRQECWEFEVFCLAQ